MSHPTKMVYLHPLVERIWHWVHAACICGLALTGIGIHWPGIFAFAGGLDTCVWAHNLIAWVTMADFVLWLGLNLVMGRMHHYIPKKSDFGMAAVRQIWFYAAGAFLGQDNPAHPSPQNKFNPMQKISYLVIMGVFMPLVIITGLLYLYPVAFAGVIEALGGLTIIAIVHFVVASCLTTFMVVHVYLCTLGVTVKEDFTHMVTGYGEAHGDH